MSANQRYLKEAQAHAEEFAREQDAEHLREAYQALENVILLDEGDPEIRGTLRTQSLHMWLHLLQILDGSLDPDFDPEDVPQLLVQPPPTSDGVVHRPGVDPARIDDPKARAQYKEAIAANEAKTLQYSLQTELRRLDERIMPRAEDFIRFSFTSSKADQEELKSAIEETIEAPQRKARLLELLAPPEPSGQ